ncbi:SDR family NAD(P)-dependent oxidoreductase [Caulobacter sp. FWC2]|uniref:SDR family NAD(P)-dependent oxidoreductase n=1 Tax=Caulobacter sp. FWC2 TaxID=69664 RepID=UPI000C153383|nr:SDR family NAD(P)-dependent oxidoreductase [Caulobacter sp. FWC2]PIB94001.1 short-chain dehydrogenase [Caulobacter sp. FWC2]
MLEGKRVLITGASGGLGSLVAAQLVAEGAHVVALGRSRPEGVDGFMAHDLSTPDGIETAARAVEGGQWDILINLAGVQHFGPFETEDPAELLSGYLVNLVAPVRLCQAVAPAMKARGGGQIVNIGSIFGSINFAHFATYSSAKAGLRGFSQALRRELAGTGVDVTYVAPRAVRTAMVSERVLEFAKLTQMNIDPPGATARRIVSAIRARRRDVYLGFPETFFVRLNALLPGLVDRALSANDRKAAQLFAR